MTLSKITSEVTANKFSNASQWTRRLYTKVGTDCHLNSQGSGSLLKIFNVSVDIPFYQRSMKSEIPYLLWP